VPQDAPQDGPATAAEQPSGDAAAFFDKPASHGHEASPDAPGTSGPVR
jgi:hypothetical protein